MALTRPDSRQIINRAALAKLGAAANTTQDSINSKLNLEVDSPLRLAASFPTPDAQLNFSNSLLTTGDGANKVLPPTSSQVFEALTGAFINFQTQALSNVAHFVITFPASTVGQFRRAGFTLTSAGKIQVLFSAEAATEGALANPGTVFVAGVPLGYVNLVCTNVAGQFKTAGSATNIIENAKVYRFGAGGGGSSSSSGSGLGDDLDSLSFRASFSDDFSDTPSASTSAVDTTRTNASYDAVAAAYRMSYDASKTITGTGTAMTLSGTPGFTVAAGDVVVNLVTLEVKRIASISSQTAYTLESAFAADPTAVAVCVSQAVHTNDVRAHTENATGLSIASQISDNASTYMLRYRDSAAASDAIWDMPGAALVAFSASADNSSWSTLQTRVTNLSTTEPVRSVPVAGSQFKARFFANATSGTGAVNVLDWKAYLHQDSNTSSGAIASKALARTDGAGTGVNASVSSSTGKTRITTSFAFGTEVQVYLDGKKIPEFVDTTVSPDASFTRISGNVIQLDDDYSGLGLQVEVLVPANTVDNTNQNASNISMLQDMATAGLQGMISEASLLAAVSGAPSAVQFRTFGIINRASIPDIQNDLRARMSIDRVQIQSIYEIFTESGSSGERVFGALNDDRNLIRMVGTITSANDTNGTYVTTSGNNTDYFEIVFYGTGLNILVRVDAGARDIRLTVDGGAEGANLYPSATANSVLNARNYNPNQVVNLVSGLTLGLHTAKIRAGASLSIQVGGFEIVNESANVNVRPGIAFIGGKKLVLSAASNVAHNSGTFDSVLQAGASVAFSTTRGARVIEYIKSDGTRGKAATLANASQANGNSADHTYEDLIRTHNWREFGAGRSDDFSTLVGTKSSRVFTLDDGTTTLVSDGAEANLLFGTGAIGALYTGDTRGAVFTFVGTGLDIACSTVNTETETYTLSIDGSSVNASFAMTANTHKIYKVVSGLPYGTHIFRMIRNNVNTTNGGIVSFRVYGPKKPTLPAGAVELCDYNVMATYVATATASADTISTGVLNKSGLRETVYTGSGWTTALTVNDPNASNVQTPTSGDAASYTFFGTGIDIGARCSAANNNQLVSIDGALYTGAATAVGAGSSWTPGTSTWVLANSGVVGPRLQITGLTLGIHTVKVQKNTGTDFLEINAWHVITPIHAPKFQLPLDLQDTITVGSCGISDSRKLSLIKSESPAKFRAQASGVTSNPTTGATSLVPLTDMNLTLNVKSAGLYKFTMTAVLQNDTANTNMTVGLYLNGAQLGQLVTVTVPNANNNVNMLATVIVPLSPGVHQLQGQWVVGGGTGTAFATRRVLLAEEM